MIGMTRYYLAAFLSKCRSKLTCPVEFAYLSWRELLFYTLRQAFHDWRNTFAGCLATHRSCDAHIAAMDTPFGTIYLPSSMDRITLRYLVRESFDRGHWHQYDTRWTPVRGTDTVVDCGASEGLWGLTVADRVGRLVLVEPQAEFVRLLEKTFARGIADGRVVVQRCALGSEDGQCSLRRGLEGDILATVAPDQLGETPLRRLDTLFAHERVDFIKADVEGFEMDLLTGAKGVIRRDMPRIAITVYHEVNDWREMRDFVRSLVPDYRWRLKGIISWGKPIMLHMWVEERKGAP